MRRNIIETVLGAAVLAVAIVFVVFAFSSTGVSTVEGYKLHARFDNAAGLTPGTDVRMSGVKIGSVVKQELNPETYFAEVTLAIQEDIKLPTDTSARIVPDGLLGSNYVMLEPGGARETLASGSTIQYTQGAINIVDMVSRLMFSSDGGGSGQGGDGGGSGQGSGGGSAVPGLGN
jgi:phospholipid/cholesterol/gamma-HCH transport system substrate-binding protein